MLELITLANGIAIICVAMLLDIAVEHSAINDLEKNKSSQTYELWRVRRLKRLLNVLTFCIISLIAYCLKV